jgi:malate dehydrogenase (quinone)
MINAYDVLIIGAGIVGSATSFLLSEFTNVKNIAIIDKRNGIAQVASNRKVNSQTLHPFGGELNYDYKMMARLKKASDMILDYVNSAYGRDYDIIRHINGMVLAVGEEEIDYLHRKFENTVKPVFPNAKLLENKEDIGKLEPYVVKDRREKIASIKLQAYMIDFGELAKSFIENVKKHKDRKIEIKLNKKVERIEKISDGYKLYTQDDEILYARYLVISAGSYTLSLAKQIGLGEDYIAFPIEGKFFYSPSVVNGKVYTVQEEGIPFASVHADKEWDSNITRYGPTALLTTAFESGSFDIKEFLNNLDYALLDIIVHKKTIRNILFKNFLYNTPVLGKHLFWKNEARKIIPSLPYESLRPAHEFGGTRTIAVNKKTRELIMGELILRKDGENAIGNCTPSPGASGCLSIAYKNIMEIVKTLDLKFYADKFEEVFSDVNKDY